MSSLRYVFADDKHKPVMYTTSCPFLMGEIEHPNPNLSYLLFVFGSVITSVYMYYAYLTSVFFYRVCMSKPMPFIGSISVVVWCPTDSVHPSTGGPIRFFVTEQDQF